MRTFLKITSVILIVLTVLIGAVFAVAFGFYETYLKPTPADFEFSRPVDSITGIELIRVEIENSDEMQLVPLITVIDTDMFISDLSALTCYKGLSLDGLSKLGELTEVDAVKVSYSDGTYEVITAYGNLNSDVLSEDTTIDEILYGVYYIFDEAEFSSLLDKYSVTE